MSDPSNYALNFKSNNKRVLLFQYISQYATEIDENKVVHCHIYTDFSEKI